jgi:hypothetical protein
VNALQGNIEMLQTVVSIVMIKFADNPDNEALGDIVRAIGMTISKKSIA